MSTPFFRFKQFTVHQQLCAMKVGTDGTLLGSWARGGERILDIGTGTGLIALMMAQRNPTALITAIDIDPQACRQAQENASLSPFAGRVTVLCTPVQQFQSGPFDAIVSNPPFFVGSLQCPDARRTAARHASTLSYAHLFQSANRLLTAQGSFSLVIPSECLSQLDAEARLCGFVCQRRCAVRTVPRKPPRRYLLEYVRQLREPFTCSDECLEDSAHLRSPWYQQLTADFYL